MSRAKDQNMSTNDKTTPIKEMRYAVLPDRMPPIPPEKICALSGVGPRQRIDGAKEGGNMGSAQELKTVFPTPKSILVRGKRCRRRKAIYGTNTLGGA